MRMINISCILKISLFLLKNRENYKYSNNRKLPLSRKYYYISKLMGEQRMWYSVPSQYNYSKLLIIFLVLDHFIIKCITRGVIAVQTTHTSYCCR